MRSSTAFSLVALLSASSTVTAQSTGWGQCGGQGWTGATTCVAGWVCTFNHQSQHHHPLKPPSPQSEPQQKAQSPPSPAPASPRPFPPPFDPQQQTSPPPQAPPFSQAPSGSAQSPPPHFHEYLQSPSSTAILGSHLTAAQFSISSGQLIQNTPSGPLYASVEQRSDASDMLLGVTFTGAPNVFGAFSWSGDSLQWTVGSIARPNPSAWYVCGEGNQLFINLGQYLYGTPAGCSDHTIHFYNGATADL